MDRARQSLLIALLVAVALAAASTATAQQSLEGVGGWYHPVNQRTPPSVAGRWSGMMGRTMPPYYQPIEFTLPTNGEVTVFQPNGAAAALQAPTQVAMLVGHVYRLKIAGLPEFPGVELWPSVEVIDRLHPPPGQAHRHPVPVPFTLEDIEMALSGRMVTKVIYVERPQTAAIRERTVAVPATVVPNHKNLIAAADARGRPMLIVRLGNVLPSPQGEPPTFYGTGAPVLVPPHPVPPPDLPTP